MFTKMAMALMLSCLPVMAFADVLDWQTTNIQILRGDAYKVGESQRTITTLEHANGWSYGDTYAFVDFIYPDGQKSSYYGEISPRLSFGKIFDASFPGVIKDVLISTTFEKARGQGPQYLYGIGVDWHAPGFKFLKTNAYVHDSTQLDGETWQVTVQYSRPFQIGDAKFVVEGFADFQGDEGTSNANQLIVPRLLLDAGDLMGFASDKLMVGVEYQYWHNKFGIEGVSESVPQLQVKWIF